MSAETVKNGEKVLDGLQSLDLKGVPVIAGPCSVESESQVLETAKRLKDCGVKIFRGGLWKPRTLPGHFEGVGSRGIDWLRKVYEVEGMDVMTEVATRHHVEEALKGGINMFWIGARTSANPFAVQEIAEAISEMGGKKCVVLVKNPPSPDLDLWIGALQRLRNQGLERLGAIHRGFHISGVNLYRNTPLWNVAIELKLRCPELPIFCDPSHMGGDRRFIASLSQEALDLGYDGLMIESHCCPSAALSDSSQQVTPEELKEILGGLVWRKRGRQTERLEELRGRIDVLDDELIGILAERLAVCREIGDYKRETGMRVLQSERFNEILGRRSESGEGMGLGKEFLRKVLLAIHEESIRQQVGER